MQRKEKLEGLHELAARAGNSAAAMCAAVVGLQLYSLGCPCKPKAQKNCAQAPRRLTVSLRQEQKRGAFWVSDARQLLRAQARAHMSIRKRVQYRMPEAEILTRKCSNMKIPEAIGREQ